MNHKTQRIQAAVLLWYLEEAWSRSVFDQTFYLNKLSVIHDSITPEPSNMET